MRSPAEIWDALPPAARVEFCYEICVPHWLGKLSWSALVEKCVHAQSVLSEIAGRLEDYERDAIACGDRGLSPRSFGLFA